MAFEHKIDRGSIFRNEDKTEDWHGDYNGSAKLAAPNGDVFEVWVNGYINETKDGKKYLGLSFKAKDSKPRTQPATAPPKNYDEEMPF